MATMSYSGAAVAAPAVGSDNSPTFFKTYFDYVMTTFNADDTIITNANAVGSVANAGKLAKYDALGGLTLANLAVTAGPVTIDGTGHILTAGALGVTGLATFNGGLVITSGAVTISAGGAIVSASSLSLATTLNVTTNAVIGGTLAVSGATGLAALTVTTFAASGNATVAGTFGVTGAITATGGVIGNASTATTATTAAALTNPVAFSGLASDYKIVPNASAGVVGINAGGQYGDSLGNLVGPLAAQTVTLPAQPSGTNIQYVAISLAPVTGAPVATGGAVGASPAKPTYPLGNTYLGMITWPGTTTLPTGVVPLANITEGRFPTSGGGGGTTGASSTVSYLTSGSFTSSGLPNALDVTNAASALAIAPQLVRDSVYGGSPSDILAGTAKSDTIGRLSSVGAVASLVYSAASPWAVAVNGRTRAANNPATQPALTATASGTANQQRTLVVDLGAATAGASDHGIRLAFIAPGTALGTYQMPLANYWWDGTTITPADNTAMSHFVDYAPVAGLSMAGVTPVLAKFTDTGANATFSNLPNASFTTLTNINTITVPALPTTMQPYLSLRFNATPTVAVGTQVQVVILVDGSFVAGFIDVLASVDSTFSRMVRFDGWLPPMAPGPHTVAIAAIGVGNTTNALSVSAGLTYGHIAFYKG